MVKRLSLKTKLLTLIIMSIVIICIVINVIYGISLYNKIVEDVEYNLRISVYTVRSQFLNNSIEELDDIIKEYKEASGVDITVFNYAVRQISTIDGAVGTDIDEDILNHIRSGDTYFTKSADVNGVSYFGFYEPYLNNGGYCGAIFAGIPRSEELGIIKDIFIKVLISTIVCLAIIIIISVIIVNNVLRNIELLEYRLDRLHNNDLTEADLSDGLKDEIGILYNKTTDFSNKLNHLINDIKFVSLSLGSTISNIKIKINSISNNSTDISKSVEGITAGAISQAENITQGTFNISSISSKLNSTKLGAEKLFNIMGEASDIKESVSKDIEILYNINSRVNTDINETHNQVNQTNKCVNDIKDALSIIKNIADQTRLLSLNASIEAARAGENGRGFSVVAENIGKLAQESITASTNIEEILKSLSSNYNTIIKNVDNVCSSSKEQTSILLKTRNNFIEFSNSIKSTIDEISIIGNNVIVLNSDVSEIEDTMTSLSAISEQNSASTEEVMASIQELSASLNQINGEAYFIENNMKVLNDKLSTFVTDRVD